MKINNAYAGIMTADIKTAQRWYQELFNRKPDYHPMKTVYEWDFQNGGVLQLVEDETRSGNSSVTLLVSDIQSVKNTLHALNISCEVISAGEIAQIITIFDPEDNRITFAANKQGRN